MEKIDPIVLSAFNNDNNILVVTSSGTTVPLKDFVWTSMGLLSQGKECLAELKPYDVCLSPCSNGIGASRDCKCSNECVNCFGEDEDDDYSSEEDYY